MDSETLVDAHLVVRELDGSLLVDGTVQHVFTLREGLVARTEVVEEAPAA